MVDLARYKRIFPFALDVQRCPDCGAWMERSYTRDPATQAHWRGVEAYVCTDDDCDYAERLE